MDPTAQQGRLKDQSETGRRLEELLKQRQLTISELSRRSGVSVSQISYLLRGGIAAPRASTVQKIADGLDVPVAWLLPSNSSGGTEIGADSAFPGRRGIVVVPIVRLDVTVGREPLETGESVYVPADLLSGRSRLLATVVNGGGMAPAILTGDTVVYDPDAAVDSDMTVVCTYLGATICAWHLQRDGRSIYRLSDGTTLAADDIVVHGRVVTIWRDPPSAPPF